MEPERPPIFAIALGATTAATRLFRFGRALRVTVIVKASFALVPEGIATPVGPEPVYARELPGHATTPASILRPSDLAPHMPCAAVMLVGHARAPRGHAVPSLTARLFVVGDVVLVDKSILVFGDRPHPAAPPTPFEKMPLAWERTYGGPFFTANPVGMGADPGDHRLQNLVDPTGAVVPVCFAPISKHWLSRRSLLAASPSVVPGPVLDVPDTFDWTYFVPCAPDQRAPFLVGGEWIVLDGVHPDHPRLRTRLPVLRGLARLHTASPAREALPPFALTLDTVLVDTDAERVSLTFRGSAEVPEACPFDAITAVAGVEIAGETLRFPSIDEVALRRRAEEGPTRVALRTEPPPAALLPSFNEGTERLDPALVAALSRPLAPFPVAAPLGLAASPAPIPGSPWGPPVEPAPEALPVSDPETADIAAFQRPSAGEVVDEPGTVEPPTTEVVRDSPPPAPLLGPPPSEHAGLVAQIVEAPIIEPPTNETIPDEPLEERPNVAPPLVLAAPLQSALPAPVELDPESPRARVIAAISQRALLDGWDLSGADLSGLDLSALSLARANLRRANLRDARLSGADLTQADLTGATLAAASLRGATLAEARLDDVRAEDADFTAIAAPKMRCVGGQLARANFARSDLTGAILEKSDLDDATFFEATLRGAGLVGASCRRVDFGAADLSEARLRETAVAGARFSEAKLRGAKLQRAEGEGVVFTSADLEGADLRNATLVEADFQGALLRRAWMDNAKLSRARMTRADLGRASLRGTKLDGADLEEAKLDGADLRDADLTAAKLTGATRVGAKMVGAKLDEAPDEKTKAGS